MAPSRSWPSPPTLKMPTREPMSQATPHRQSTMAYSSTSPMCLAFEKAPLSMAA